MSGSVARTREEMLDFLRTHVRRVPGSDCLLWAGVRDGHGNPRISWHYRNLSARRLLVELIHGCSLSPDVQVVYTCDEVACMNEEHLQATSRTAVAELARFRGRLHGGAAHALAQALAKARQGAKLPIHEHGRVLQMRLEGLTFAEIGQRYGVTGPAVHAALARWTRIRGDTKW